MKGDILDNAGINSDILPAKRVDLSIISLKRHMIDNACENSVLINHFKKVVLRSRPLYTMTMKAKLLASKNNKESIISRDSGLLLLLYE